MEYEDFPESPEIVEIEEALAHITAIREGLIVLWRREWQREQVRMSRRKAKAHKESDPTQTRRAA